MHGLLMNNSRYGWVVWAHGENDSGKHISGYISKEGGLVKKVKDARHFEGCGTAIRVAQVHGVAITEY